LDSTAETAIGQLAALQEVDRFLREKSELIRGLETEIAAIEAQLAERREMARVAQVERDAVEARRRDLEAHLEAEEAKMTDRRMRLNRVRNEKELQALRREIEVSKELNQQVEEGLLGVFESLEGLNATATEAEKRLTELETVAATELAEKRERIAALIAEGASKRAARDEMAKALDGNLRRKYEQIFERRGGTAVVEVRNGTCLGCHMNLPPQFFNELQRARDVRSCPNCHRILFWRPERLEPEATPR